MAGKMIEEWKIVTDKSWIYFQHVSCKKDEVAFVMNPIDPRCGACNEKPPQEIIDVGILCRVWPFNDPRFSGA